MIDELTILDLYHNGKRISEISRAGYGSPHQITKILKKNNITIIKGPPKKELPKKEINNLYQSGISTIELALKYNCSDETIRKIITNKRSITENNKNRNNEIKNKISKSCKAKWQDEEYRIKITSTNKKQQINKCYKKQILPNVHNKIVESKLGRIDSINGPRIKLYEATKIIECKTSDCIIKQIDEKIAKLFYETFHYTSTIRKGATTYGAYFNDKLIAAISYTSPMRLETAKSLNVNIDEIKEISRLAIASNVECENLGSFLIGNTIRKLPKSIKIIVSYSDSTVGHNGGIYKASNFIKDRIIENNYHYETANGIKFHKKTIWDKSKKMKTHELDYAIKHNLIKVIDLPKSRWVFVRK